jgi:hypothetical protein
MEMFGSGMYVFFTLALSVAAICIVGYVIELQPSRYARSQIIFP